MPVASHAQVHGLGIQRQLRNYNYNLKTGLTALVYCHAPMVPPTTGPAGPSMANFVAIDGQLLSVVKGIIS